MITFSLFTSELHKSISECSSITHSFLPGCIYLAFGGPVGVHIYRSCISDGMIIAVDMLLFLIGYVTSIGLVQLAVLRLMSKVFITAKENPFPETPSKEKTETNKTKNLGWVFFLIVILFCCTGMFFAFRDMLEGKEPVHSVLIHMSLFMIPTVFAFYLIKDKKHITKQSVILPVDEVKKELVQVN